MIAHLISNATMQPLIRYLRPWAITLGDYNSLLPELIDSASIASRPGVTHVFCIFDSDALFGDALYQSGIPAAAVTFVDALARFCRSHPEKTIITNTFCCSANRIPNFADVLSQTSVKAQEMAINGALIALARDCANLLLVDIEPLFRRYGEEKLIDSAFWYSGRIRYTNIMFRVLAQTLKDALHAYEQQARKVLVLDLDNTLWGGVLGDLGPDGIELSESGAGAAFRDLQRAIKGLKETGILLVVCSKNNQGDVDEVFVRNRMMILSRQDFACIFANWNPKPENIVAAAQTLNLAVESFVCIDDSPAERQLLCATLPQLTVPDFPERTEMLPQWFITDVVYRYFGKYRLTAEDLNKTEQYHVNEVRRSAAVTYTIEQFISDLNIRYAVHVDDPQTVVRASQMTQKTNQFNVTTFRCDVPMITQYVQSPQHALVVLEYEDRFGSEGNVALAMIDVANGYITNFLMSCRVIGRNVEQRLIEETIHVARGLGLSSLSARYVPSPKNAQVATLYEGLGFTLTGQDSHGVKLYEREIQ